MVENAFGILANRFRILLTAINLDVDKVELIAYACVLLHSFPLDKYQNWYIPPSFRDGSRESNLESVPQQGGNGASNDALIVRNKFSLCFNTIGALQRQVRREVTTEL